jgi:hypothetical protein
MHVLFAISILALVALLLASAAILQHVRRSRRKRRRFLEENTALAAATVHELAFTEGQRIDDVPRVVAFEPEPEAAAPPPFPSAEAALDSSRSAGFAGSASMLDPETVSIAAALELATHNSNLRAASSDHTSTSAQTAAADSAEEAKPAVESAATETEASQSASEDAIAEKAAPESEPSPVSEPVFAAAARILAATPRPLPALAPLPPRSTRISSARHPLAQLVPPMERPDWAYFNKDMGDLSDPEPSRSRVRDLKTTKQRS